MRYIGQGLHEILRAGLHDIYRTGYTGNVEDGGCNIYRGQVLQEI